MADEDVVYYCGNCRRQQEPSKGEKCKQCGKTTVNWNIRKETEAEAQRRWNKINGKG